MSNNESKKMEQLKSTYEGIFSRSAATYDHVGPGFFSHFGRQLVRFARLPAEARVLDVACGRGAVLFPAVEAVGPAGEVVGVDLSSEMVAETAREITTRGIPNARVMQMDAEHLQFAAGSFDFVLCSFALFFFPDMNQALAEIQRVLAPGGQITVSTWSANEDERWEWLDKLMKAYTPPEPEEEADKTEPAPDFCTPNGVKSILENAGFRLLRAETASTEIVFHDEAEWWAVSWSHGGRLGLEEIERTQGAAGLECFKAEAFEHLKSFKTTGGFPERMEVVFAAGQKE